MLMLLLLFLLMLFLFLSHLSVLVDFNVVAIVFVSSVVVTGVGSC